ncbi:DUF5671 domain-containing protein [Chloroflexus sp.]|uniref:DUF5671 domain-containing protein n=1 Tax=Chloroflexus sp. TaxID=1904827 RepID=UPI002ACEFA3B|nr:DUF5671 domain-containing protein [Chloroflexus sp.]
MAVVRRWYLYVSAAIGLQGFTWALIGLLDNAFAASDRTAIGATAFQLAIFAACLPLWFVHWLWGERLAQRDQDERASAVRKLYLYGNLAAFLMPLITNVYRLLETATHLLIGANLIDPRSSLGYSLIASLILGALFGYHSVVARNDAHQAPLTGAGALIRRVYLLAFAAFGVLIWANAVIELIRLIFGFANGRAGVRLLSDILIELLIGMVVWLGHWWRAQRLFASADEDERGSAFRKFYLYAVIVGASLTAVTIVTSFLASIFRSWLGLPVSGNLIDVIAPAAVWAIVAFYHVSVINADAAAIAEGPRQTGVRRLAWYLVAAIGQLAALVGAGGLISVIISVIIRGLAGEGLITDLREPLAWFSAVLVAGLPIWFWCWRHVQRAAAMAGEGGIAERSSLVRRIYLFGFLFVASLTLLSTLIYILSRLISIALGEPFSGNLLADLAQAIAYSLIAVGVLVTHGLAVRTDSRVREAAERSRQAQVRVAVLAEGELAERIAGALRERFPQLALAIAGGAVEAETQLANADLIVGVWQPSSDPSQLDRYPARKLLIPIANPNWAWVGIEPAVATNIPAQLVQAVRQTLAGEPLRPQRGVGAGVVVGALIAIVVVTLVIVGIVQVTLFAFR